MPCSLIFDINAITLLSVFIYRFFILYPFPSSIPLKFEIGSKFSPFCNSPFSILNDAPQSISSIIYIILLEKSSPFLACFDISFNPS